MTQKEVPNWLILLVITVILVPNLELLIQGASKPVNLIVVVSTISLAESLLSLALQRRILAHWTIIFGAALSGASVILS